MTERKRERHDGTRINKISERQKGGKKKRLAAKTSWKKKARQGGAEHLCEDKRRSVIAQLFLFSPRGPSENNWRFKLGQIADRGMTVGEEENTAEGWEAQTNTQHTQTHTNACKHIPPHA